MRRVFALLLVTPLLANCSDSATPTPVAPAGAVLSEGAVLTEGTVPTDADWVTVDDWFTAEDMLSLVEEDVSVLSAVSPLQAAPPAVMEFGNPDAGTSYPPGVHDQSLHARDRINPGAIVINAGETVTFKMNPGHRVAIYKPGTKPEDILPTPGFFLLYPVGRLFLQPVPTPQLSVQFLTPGKYLVVCAINSHFFGANMWGWIHVR